MALCLTFRSRIKVLTSKAVTFHPVRFRWKPPNNDEIVYPPYADRIAQWRSRYKPPASNGVNIGFHFNSSGDSSQKQDLLKTWALKKNLLEQAARHRTLKVDLGAVKEEWLSESMPEHISKVVNHYGIFQDMFDGAYFNPIVPLNVSFDYDEEFVTPVYYGNIIPAAETSVKPYVSYDSKEDSLWTLTMTSPDGNLEDDSKELLHWFVCNIPGISIENGELCCDYLQPFPPKGVGFLRYVFVLYKQDGVLDFTKWKRPTSCLSLRERSFSSLNFYQQNEDHLTPAGLSFFQSKWDKSVTTVFHHDLEMKEPVFEFIHPPFYYPEQVPFPHKQPFNLYLDRYRDIKDIQEEVLKEKLKHRDISKSIFTPQYPCIDLVSKETPSWKRVKIDFARKGKHQWTDLYND